MQYKTICLCLYSNDYINAFFCKTVLLTYIAVLSDIRHGLIERIPHRRISLRAKLRAAGQHCWGCCRIRKWTYFSEKSRQREVRQSSILESYNTAASAETTWYSGLSIRFAHHANMLQNEKSFLFSRRAATLWVFSEKQRNLAAVQSRSHIV